MDKQQENFLEFLKDRYYFELDRKERLNGKVNNPMTIIILVLGVISYYIQNLNNASNSVANILFFVFIGITMVWVVVTGFYLKKSFYGYDYSYLPKAFDIEKDILAIHDYYKDSYFSDFKKKKIENLVDQDIYELYKNNFCTCIDQNIESNTKKNEFLLKTSGLLTLTLLFLFVSSVIFYSSIHN